LEASPVPVGFGNSVDPPRLREQDKKIDAQARFAALLREAARDPLKCECVCL
jgi:hypothetical protein